MLLHVTHSHTAESCPGPHRDRIKVLSEGFNKLEETAKSNNVKLVSASFAFAEHLFFFVIDAPSTAAAQTFLGAAFPGMLATVHMTPVIDLAEAKSIVAGMARG